MSSVTEIVIKTSDKRFNRGQFYLMYISIHQVTFQTEVIFMKHKVNRFIAALAAMTALTTSMVGFSANAAEVNTPEKEIIIDRYVQYQTYYFDLDKTNGTTSDDSLTITKTTNEDDFKISYGHCTVGQAIVEVWIDGVKQSPNYIIPASSGVSISHTYSCNVGSTITVKISPASGYLKAKGSITVYW